MDETSAQRIVRETFLLPERLPGWSCPFMLAPVYAT